MAQCVQSARRAGVFKEFHIFTDRPIEGCECYDANNMSETKGWFKTIYLKLGMSRLLFDYFIWLDADHWFVRNPKNILETLGKSPIHVPLTGIVPNINTSGLKADGLLIEDYHALMVECGLLNPVYVSQPFLDSAPRCNQQGVRVGGLVSVTLT